MSRLYDTLRKIEREKRRGAAPSGPDQPVELLNNIVAGPVEIRYGSNVTTKVAKASRLVAFTDPKSLSAEKFRALAARLENLSKKGELSSLQVTSAVINEGKSLVAANLAITLVRHFAYRVLLVEGDLHRPTLTTLFGLANLEGINQWWLSREKDKEISPYVHRLDGMPLWLLSAGSTCEQPSQILQSARFGESFVGLAGCFDWTIVDSTPMTPIVDANLWSRLVDGTLLVVREGVTPIKTLKAGVRSLDNPKWLGAVLNEASEFDRVNYQYYGQYYGTKKA
jgi:capsular exopolysaccharide synthesis family protein